MKSLMEEASTISKAVEKGWIRAGKPQEFTVKIYEEPQKNIFGLTTKPAKIAIIFNEVSVLAPEKKPRVAAPSIEIKKPEREISPKGEKVDRPKVSPPDLVSFAKQWIQGFLRTAHMEHISFTSHASGNAVHIRFDASLTGSPEKDRLLFSGFAYLILGALRNKFKREFKNVRIIITTAA